MRGVFASIVSASVLSLFVLLPACSSAPEESEADDTEEQGLELSSNPNSGYFLVTRPDFRRCMSPFCGGYFVKRVNASKTRCMDGTYQAECYVGSIDTAAIGLDPGAPFEGQLRSGKALVRATFKPEAGFATVAKLVVAEGWVGRAASAPTGTFYRLTPSGVRCFGAPCPTYREGKLNSSRTSSADDLDLGSTRPRASQSSIDDAMGQVASPSGILVAGDHKSFRAPLGMGSKLVASEFYTRVIAPPKKQECGGDMPNQVPCPKGTFCSIPMEGICGAADASGFCEPRPDACIEIYQPVCGCDQKTYSNACHASQAGTSIASEGECAPSVQACGSRGMGPCPTGEYCSFAAGTQCGGLDQGGSCAVKPQFCTKIGALVCGCDGKTYGNPCMAAASGVSIASTGACGK